MATNNVHYATPAGSPLATALAAVRARRSLDELADGCRRRPGAHLRSARRAGAPFRPLARGGEPGRRSSARACAFDLRLVAPRLPALPRPAGHDEQSWLASWSAGGHRRYGPRAAERVPGAWAQLDHELEVIGALGFAGYFLTVWDIVEFCRRHDIYCQGRGSAANSAVCYALGITWPTRSGSACCSSGSSPPRATVRPTSTSTSSRGGARRSSSTSTSATAGATPPRWPTSSPTGPLGIRDMGKALGHPPRRSTVGPRAVDAARPLDRADRLPAGGAPTGRARCWTSPGTWASTPGAWSSATGR